MSWEISLEDLRNAWKLIGQWNADVELKDDADVETVEYDLAKTDRAGRREVTSSLM